jgi:hypothetical protein
MLRPFGAGFGIGTVCVEGTLCAEDGTATLIMDAAISMAMPIRMPRIASCSVIASFEFLFNASSCLAFGHFIVLSAKAAIVFP